MVPLFRAADVYEAVSPERAVDAVRDAFVAYARGEWTMPPKVYVPAYPAGDFRAMPANGGGFALLKWISSFPGNPSRGLPTVLGTVLLSDASCGKLLALFDAASLTALRTGAAAVLAAETLGREGAGRACVVGAGVNGKAVARTFQARGHDVAIHDLDRARAEAAAGELGVDVVESQDDAVAADVVVTVTPGKNVLLKEGTLRDGQHVSLMGADGPDKCEIAPAELARVSAFCDDWGQASHAGDLAHAVEAGLLAREHVTEIGAVLTDDAPGRRSADEITAFDSTGLAIQDLAIALAAYEVANDLDLPTVDL
ncbi:MAG TPA: ornithine cyclodeaminase family protein [Gaiellaceae bacterium]|nr:ornithine cyclodeaminase family protein [Gaiellaceae bacterium]